MLLPALGLWEVTLVLSEADKKFMRESHEALMYDTVRITRSTGSMEWDEELKRMVETREASIRYEGKARVFLEKADGIVIGESTATVNRTQGYVTIPKGAILTVQEGDMITVTSRVMFPKMYITSVGEDAFTKECSRFAVVTDRNQVQMCGEG